MGMSAKAQYGGRCVINASLDAGPLPVMHRYTWVALLPRRSNGPIRYDPLFEAAGGTIVAAAGNVKDGSGTLGEVQLIPDEWRDSVAGAVAYLRAHPSLRVDEPAKEGRDPPTLLDDPNPFLSVAAFRRIARARPEDPRLARALTAGDPIYRAACAYVLLGLTTASADPASPVIGRLIDEARDADALRPLALAAWTVTRDSGAGAPREAAMGLVARIRHRLASEPAIHDDQYLKATLDRADGKATTKPARPENAANREELRL